MPNLKTIRRAALVFGGALLLAAGSTAFAHTTVRDQATEGTSSDNAFKVAHGCTQLNLGVTAQSVVFPANSPVITTSDGSVITDLGAIITQGGIAGLLKPIQDKNIFKSQLLKTDALGNVIGFSATVGMLAPPIPGRVPWQFTSPNFEPTGCAKRILVQIAIADVCVRGVNGPADSLQASKVNLWIPNNGSNFATVAGAAKH